MAHHLTALVAIAVLAAIALASSIVRVRRGVSPDGSSFLLVSILTAATALYFWLYAYRGFGHALLMAKAFVGDSPFMVCAGDKYIVSRDEGFLRRMAKPPLGLLYAIYHEGGDAPRLQLVGWGSWRRGWGGAELDTEVSLGRVGEELFAEQSWQGARGQPQHS
jgi:hypothetical protein